MAKRGLIVEFDGEASHATRRAFYADRRRDAALAAEGYVVVRLTWERIIEEAETVVSELQRVLTMRKSSAWPTAAPYPPPSMPGLPRPRAP